MNPKFVLTSALVLAAAPLAYAHTDGGVYGTPKLYCEDVKGDTDTHDYGHPVTGLIILFALDASVPPCPYDPMWDGHYEWAPGGAHILACEASCGNPYGKAGDGTLVCWGTYADHNAFPTLATFDHGLTPLGLDVLFEVAADYWDNVPNLDPTEPNCGDFESDYRGLCINVCSVDFPPGKDGTYQVYLCIPGSYGHVSEVPGIGAAPLYGGCPI